MVESNLDDGGDGKIRCSSTFQKTVMLKDWWLIKCTNEFEGKRFGVAGIEIMASAERRAVRVFTSSPIVKAFDVFTLETSDGNCIIIRGFLNKDRVVQNGFSPEISRHFVFGFPPCWEQILNDCFEGGDINTETLKINKAYCTVLSPCKNKKTNIEDTPVQNKDKSNVSETKAAEVNGQDGRSDGSRTGDKQSVGRKSQRLQAKASGKTAANKSKLNVSEVENPTTDGDHLNESLEVSKRGDKEKHESVAIEYPTTDGDHCNGSLEESKRGDEEKHESVAIENDVTSPVCTDSVQKVTSKNTSRESPSSELRKSKRKATSAFPSLQSKASCKTAANIRKLNVSEAENPTTDGDHCNGSLEESKRGDEEKHESVAIENDVTSPACTDSVHKVTSKSTTRESPRSEPQKSKRKATSAFPSALLKDLDKRSKPRKKGKSALKSDINVVDTKENLSAGKTKRKIAFDMEVTPDKSAKKQDTNMVSPESVGQRRSRSGRVLVSSLEFWRNQIPVYDMDRKLIRVQKGHDVTTPSKGLS